MRKLRSCIQKDHVFVALPVQERSYEDSVGQRHSAGEYEVFYAKMNVNTCTVCEIGLFTEELEKLGFWQLVCHCSGIKTPVRHEKGL